MAYTKLNVICPVLREGVHYLTSDYKTRNRQRPTHSGMDIIGKGYACDYVIAIEKGTVVKAKYSVSAGYYVEIQHENGAISRYLHMKKSSIRVSKGNVVAKGQILGYMGNTGQSNGAHLHFGVKVNGVHVDPKPYLMGEKTFANTNSYEYQVYDNEKRAWLPNVKTGTSDYAGITGNPIGGLYIDKLTYRAYDNKKKKWLPWVKGRTDYAGIRGNNIGGVQIKNATYRVHLKGGNWLAWVNGTDDYAGIKGKAIDRVQIK